MAFTSDSFHGPVLCEAQLDLGNPEHRHALRIEDPRFHTISPPLPFPAEMPPFMCFEPIASTTEPGTPVHSVSHRSQRSSRRLRPMPRLGVPKVVIPVTVGLLESLPPIQPSVFEGVRQAPLACDTFSREYPHRYCPRHGRTTP